MLQKKKYWDNDHCRQIASDLSKFVIPLDTDGLLSVCRLLGTISRVLCRLRKLVLWLCRGHNVDQ